MAGASYADVLSTENVLSIGNVISIGGTHYDVNGQVLEETQDRDTEEDWDAPPGYFEYLRNPSEETSNTMKKDQDAEIARFGALIRPEASQRLDAIFASAKEKMLEEEEEALAGWNEDNIDSSMVYLPDKSGDPSKEKCLVKWDHPVVAYLNAMELTNSLGLKFIRFSKDDCVNGTDYIKAYATEVRMCLTKIKARLRTRDS